MSNFLDWIIWIDVDLFSSRFNTYIIIIIFIIVSFIIIVIVIIIIINVIVIIIIVINIIIIIVIITTTIIIIKNDVFSWVCLLHSEASFVFRRPKRTWQTGASHTVLLCRMRTLEEDFVHVEYGGLEPKTCPQRHLCFKRSKIRALFWVAIFRDFMFGLWRDKNQVVSNPSKNWHFFWIRH